MRDNNDLKGFSVCKFGNLYNNCFGGARNLQSGTIIISKGLVMQFHSQFIILQWEIKGVVLFDSWTATFDLDILGFDENVKNLV